MFLFALIILISDTLLLLLYNVCLFIFLFSPFHFVFWILMLCNYVFGWLANWHFVPRSTKTTCSCSVINAE